MNSKRRIININFSMWKNSLMIYFKWIRIRLSHYPIWISLDINIRAMYYFCCNIYNLPEIIPFAPIEIDIYLIFKHLLICGRSTSFFKGAQSKMSASHWFMLWTLHEPWPALLSPTSLFLKAFPAFFYQVTAQLLQETVSIPGQS